jgi:RNA polymerase sigma-70 factor (family 1)
LIIKGFTQDKLLVILGLLTFMNTLYKSETIEMNVSQLTDAALMDGVRNDDRKAFRELYDRYQDKMYLLAFRKVHSKEIAEEIVQEVFVDLWEKRHRLNISEIRNYIFRSVKNGVLDYVRAQIVRQNYAKEFALQPEPASNDADDTLALRELTTAIDEGMDNLSDKTREIFKYNRLESLSADEIANILNIPKRTVEYHITVGLRTMRTALKHFILFWTILFQL